MKKVLIALVVIIIVVAGGYAIFHKSNDTTPTKSSNSSSSTAKSNAPAVNNAVLITKTDSKLGQYLADPSGKALYTYNADSDGVSNCTGSCITNWPAYVDNGPTTGLPAGVGTTKRSDDGKMQYTYNGQPLYYFAGDSNGQVTGDGVENFKIARPAAPSSSTSGSSSSSSSSQTSQPGDTSTNSSSSGYPY